jgi:hypothetical protein
MKNNKIINHMIRSYVLDLEQSKEQLIENCIMQSTSKTPVRQKKLKSRPLKAIAVALAAALVLTIGVGAVNDWDYSNIFGKLFGGNFNNSEFAVPHTIKPQVSNMKNSFK